ncbi:hypothetical protein [Nocardioides sp. MH1]|uniref:hypothetical protein n=1 Tax=Nocardioides sp. MH1 TaxID=3242490 RepID=UPI003522B742
MAVWQRVLTYGGVLVVVFGAALGVGRLVGPVDTASAGHGHDADTHDATTAGEYRLALAHDVVDGGRAHLAFRILDASGTPVTSYELQHEKELHLIAVRRDLAEFRHVHPTLDRASGVWSVPVGLDAGTWRLYADFVPTGGEQAVAESDLSVAGDFAPRGIGPDQVVSHVDGYVVRLERDGAMLTLHVSRGGHDVTDLEPYLGAYGHLVAIRADDLAYLHVHPEDAGPGPEIPFHAELDQAGRYRLFLDFQHGGRVHTADFTITVDGPEGGDQDDTEMEMERGGHDH